MKRIKVEKQIGQYTFSIETGALAKQAAGAVTVQYGDTVVLVAAATDAEARPAFVEAFLTSEVFLSPAGDPPADGRCPECGHELRVHEATWDSSVDRWEDHQWTVCINPVCAWPGEHSYSSGSYLFG